MDEIWLVWVREGKYGDDEPKVARGTLALAYKWCEDNARLHGAGKVNWESDTYGFSVNENFFPCDCRSPCNHPNEREFHYTIESLPFR